MHRSFMSSQARPVRRTLTHLGAAIGAGLLTLLIVSETADAQASTPRRLQFWTTVAAFVPTGANSHVLKNGSAFGSSVSFALTPTVSLTGSFLKASSKEESIAADGIDVYQYDIGAEAGTVVIGNASWRLRSFLGAGIGGRSYNYQDLDIAAQHNLSSYAAVGTQLQVGRLGWRIQARDYVSGFKGLSGELGSSATRNDLMFSSGFSVAF